MRSNLGAYWKRRKESPGDCARRLTSFLSAISASDQVFSNWYRQGRLRSGLSPLKVDVRDIMGMISLIESGTHKRDLDGSVIPELGFTFGITNRQEANKWASLTISCGSYAASGNVGNAVVMDLPEDLGELHSAERMATVVAAAARAWEPEWAGVFSG